MRAPNKIIIFSVAVCFLANFFGNNSIQGSIINAFLFLGYLKLYDDIVGLSFGWKILPLLALIPIFSFEHNYYLVYFVEIFVLLIFYLIAKIKNRSFRFGLLIVLVLVCLYASFSSSHIISWPIKVDWERLLYPQHLFQLEVERQQKESLYLLYPLRFIVFSDLTTYSYLFLSNLFTFLSLENLYRTLLLVNVYFLVVGLLKIKEIKQPIKASIISCLLVSLVVAGLVKTPDAPTSLSISRGALLLVVFHGINSAKKARWLYFPLWLLSILLMLGLQI